MTRILELIAESPEKTMRLGDALGRLVKGGEVIALVGPLGAGKTCFVRGVAAGNRGDEECEVTSPTFTLVNEYTGYTRLFHLDAYRLRSAEELWAVGFEDLLAEDTVVLIEWADRVRAALPADLLCIEFIPTGERTRRLLLTGFGPTGENLLLRYERAVASTDCEASGNGGLLETGS